MRRQCRFATEIGLGPIDKAFQTTLQHGVVGGKITLPRAVALFDPQRIQREHAKGFQAQRRARHHHGLINAGRIGQPGVNLPTQFACEGHPEQKGLGPRDLRGLQRQPALGQIGIADLRQNLAAFRPGQNLARPLIGGLRHRQSSPQMTRDPITVMRLGGGCCDQQNLIFSQPRRRHFRHDPAHIIGEIRKPQPPDVWHFSGDLAGQPIGHARAFDQKA